MAEEKREHHITIKDWYSTKTKYGGQIGFHYLQRRGRTIENINDYKLFVADESNGLTALGQLLFQQSIESFVYSVLGSQASTRWAIVDEGAKSLQTQVVFRKIVNDTVIEDDQTITINDMRRAILDTKVILNTAICPGLILIPSSQIILKKKIPGFNDILTMADYWMKFGENKTVNKVVVPPSPVKKKTPPKRAESPTRNSPKTKDDVRTTPKHNLNPFRHSNNSNLKGFTGQNNTGNFQRTDKKDNVGGGGNTRQLMTLYGLSAVAGFAGQD